MGQTPKLNIGLVFDDSLDSADGVAQYVKTLGGWLSGQGHQVSYLVGETKTKELAGAKVYSLAKNQKVIFNGNRLSMPLPADNKNIRSVIDSQNYDVLHVMMPYSPFMAQRVIKYASPKTAVVGTFHIYPSGLVAKAGSWLLRLLYGRSMSKISDVISVSSAAAGFAQKTFGLKSVVIPNPVDVSKFQKKPSSKPAQKGNIVFLGRLVKRKGCRQLLETFAILAQSEPYARLTIAGDGPQRARLEKLSIKLKLSGSVAFIGFVSEAEKAELLASADIACFPSLYGESFGIVLIEAMAAGAGVVIGGDNPGYRSVLGKKPELLFNPNDSAEFSKKLMGILKNPDQKLQLHEWQQKVVRQYDISQVGSQIEEVYQRAIARLNKNSHNK